MGYADLLVTLVERLSGIGADPQMASRMADTWGTRALAIIELARLDAEPARTIDGETPLLAAEVVFAVEEEAALSLTDLVMRRTMVGFGPTLAREQLGPIADLMAGKLGWDIAERDRQLADHERWLRRLASPLS